MFNHILNPDSQSEELFNIFEKIKTGNTILFLGAGASIGEKKYLSQEIIQYYETFLGKQYHEGNITKFLDMLSADPSFRRSHFDDDVEKMLRKYTLTEGHEILASIPWREIITTNYDLLVEQAFDKVKATSNHLYDLTPIREVREYNYRSNNSEIKYVKLNGCISDKGRYPLAFSTEDFNKLRAFYKTVLHDLKNLSDNVSFLSMGYSFTDSFGQQLIEKFDSFNYRDRKWIFNVDPFPNESALPYYSQQRIAVIKTSFQDFFIRYKNWEAQNLGALVGRKKLVITNSRDSQIAVPPKLLLNLDGVLNQLSSHTKDRYIKDIDYYKGEEPNYNVITRELDVIKPDGIKAAKLKIESALAENHSPILPLFFMTGEFGIGKSTFTLRLIHELSKDADLDLVAFEVLDFQKLNKDFLIELLERIKSKNVIFYCDEVEVESTFKALLALQRELSIEQFNDSNIFFLVPIRENILAKFRTQRDLIKTYEIEVDGTLKEEETNELIRKLKNVGLVEFRDESERRNLVKKIQSEYQNNSFISLMELITNGQHVNDLISAYRQLSPDAQSAFLYTALLHKHKLALPASWLKDMISLDWKDFTQNVIKTEGKGILIQEIRPSFGTTPDLFFKTKHPIIAIKLIEKILPNLDTQYSYYERIFKTVNLGATNSTIATNLLKALLLTEDYTQAKINKLYDHAYGQLSEDPYFLLNYAINLQYRGDLTELKKAINLLMYAESLLEKERRKHKFIHRRAVINFEIAKIYFDIEDDINYTATYLTEAKELFITKQLIDPFSAYSYVDYIKLLIWDLENINYSPEEDIKKQIQIEELLDVATRTVTDGVNRIHAVQATFAEYLRGVTDNQSYKEYIDNLYTDVNLRPYACILLYNYHEQLDSSAEILDQLIQEMNHYLDNTEVVKFLFKYYGQRLYEPNNRISFLRLGRQNPSLEKQNPARYYYFKFIAESYNHNFSLGKDALANIRNKYNTLNPEFHYLWRDSNGNDSIFEGQVIKKDKEKDKAIKIPELQQTFKLIKGNYEAYKLGQNVNVKLHFYLYGIKAEIIENN